MLSLDRIVRDLMHFPNWERLGPWGALADVLCNVKLVPLRVNWKTDLVSTHGGQSCHVLRDKRREAAQKTERELSERVDEIIQWIRASVPDSTKTEEGKRHYLYSFYHLRVSKEGDFRDYEDFALHVIDLVRKCRALCQVTRILFLLPHEVLVTTADGIVHWARLR